MRSLMVAGLAMSALAFAAADAASGGGDAPAGEKKSIVPAKYAGKYKNGGSDPLAEFIKEQCSGKEGFEFPAFFSLCRLNNIPEEQVSKYEAAIAAEAHGAPGRARMTLRNMLATIARKEGKLKGLDKKDHEVVVAKPAVSGAAAKQAEAKADVGKGSAPATKSAGNGKKK